jgi:hypothetical protein
LSGTAVSGNDQRIAQAKFSTQLTRNLNLLNQIGTNGNRNDILFFGKLQIVDYAGARNPDYIGDLILREIIVVI